MPDIEILRTLITEQVNRSTDADLLDLIYTLLLQECPQQRFYADPLVG